MTTNFALSLSSDGISLLHRVQRGWRIIGTASVDDPDLGDALAQMRDKALAIDPGGLRSKLVIPLDQIKYLAIDSTLTDLDDIHAALDGATPYTLDELVIDFERSGGRTHIAAVARETLDEAESFARAHGFNPVCFVAVPEPFTFQAEVFFGPTAMMKDVLGPGGVVERDALPVLVVGTRIKSRLLILDDSPEDHNDLDLTALLSRGGVTVQTNDDTDTHHAEEAAIADLFAANEAKVTPPTAEPMAAVPQRIDPVIAEYHPPVPPAPAPSEPVETAIKSVTAPVLPRATSRVVIDRVIPEYRPDQHKVLPAVTPLIAERPKAAPIAAKKQANQPKSRTPLVAAAAIAAVVALSGWAFWPSEQATPDAPVQVAENVSDSRDTAQPQPAPPTVDVAPNAPQQIDATLTAPQTPRLALTTPDVFAAPVHGAPVQLADATVPDTVVTDVQNPPAPQDAAAAVGTPVLRGQILTPDEAARAYAATGVWQRAPRFATIPRTTAADDMVRPTDLAPPLRQIAQPIVPDTTPDAGFQSFLAPADPPPADVVFPIDENGFILATPEGTVTPEGAIVFAGRPDITVRTRPELTEDDLARMAALAPAPEGVVIVPGPPAVQPPVRPDDIAPPSVSAGGVALTGLVGGTATASDAAAQPALRPRLRPGSVAQQAQTATAPENPDITSVIAGIASEEAATPFIDMTPRAVGASQRPVLRPRNFDTVVASARARQQPAPSAPEPAPEPEDDPPFEMTLPQSTAPVPGGVARAATEDNVIALREMNLIGIYGRSNARRALVRLSNGRYVRVEVGSTLDGGQVTAIGESALNYVKRGRTLTLELPAG